VKVAMGTDAGVGPHGDNLRELGLLQRAGMSPAAALRSATQEAARLLGVDDRLGTIEPGKAADLVVFDGDPLVFDGLGSRVEQVWIDGTRRV
jgi:imidazolonepropionase-like amidohydrolase